MRPLLIALLLLATTGCATGKMAYKDVKGYVKQVNRDHGCIGVEIKNDAAICISDIYFTVKIRY
jgi:hypothetical protein